MPVGHCARMRRERVLVVLDRFVRAAEQAQHDAPIQVLGVLTVLARRIARAALAAGECLVGLRQPILHRRARRPGWSMRPGCRRRPPAHAARAPLPPRDPCRRDRRPRGRSGSGGCRAKPRARRRTRPWPPADPLRAAPHRGRNAIANHREPPRPPRACTPRPQPDRRPRGSSSRASPTVRHDGIPPAAGSLNRRCASQYRPQSNSAQALAYDSSWLSGCAEPEALSNASAALKCPASHWRAASSIASSTSSTGPPDGIPAAPDGVPSCRPRMRTAGSVRRSREIAVSRLRSRSIDREHKKRPAGSLPPVAVPPASSRRPRERGAASLRLSAERRGDELRVAAAERSGPGTDGRVGHPGRRQRQRRNHPRSTRCSASSRRSPRW